MQSQKSSQNKAIKKICFSNCKTNFFICFILTPPTSSVDNFLIFFVQIEGFKLLWNRHLKLYKSSCNSKGNIVIFKDFLSSLEINYEIFDWEFFSKNDPPPLLWRAVTISSWVHFCPFLVQQMRQEQVSIYLPYYKWKGILKSDSSVSLSFFWRQQKEFVNSKNKKVWVGMLVGRKIFHRYVKQKGNNCITSKNGWQLHCF
jgi:hypothetical protein